jgi:hypothetical protein
VALRGDAALDFEVEEPESLMAVAVVQLFDIEFAMAPGIDPTSIASADHERLRC